MYHPKAGILYNGDGNIIAFQGSVNETSAAWTRNREKFDVKRSWYSEQDAEDIRCETEEFEAIWHGRDPGLLVLSLPRAVHEHLAAFLPTDGPPERDPMEIDLAQSAPALRDRIAAQWWLNDQAWGRWSHLAAFQGFFEGLRLFPRERPVRADVIAMTRIAVARGAPELDAMQVPHHWTPLRWHGFVSKVQSSGPGLTLDLQQITPSQAEGTTPHLTRQTPLAVFMFRTGLLQWLRRDIG